MATFDDSRPGVTVVDPTTRAVPARLIAGGPALHGSGPQLPAYSLRRVVEYIEAHRERTIRLVDLSALVHMSPYHFSRLFTRTVGMPPHQFIVQCRIEAARMRLTTENAPIAAIARSVGFRTPSHFATTFRRLIGMTPSAYRSGRADVGQCRFDGTQGLNT
jgi:AraC family transcriptional regulator